LLKQFQLDESAIEAEAIRQSATEFEGLDKLLASLEARRNKALRAIAEYRGEFAQRQRNSTGRIIDGKPLKLVKSS
jgi:hypothetical protein